MTTAVLIATVRAAQGDMPAAVLRFEETTVLARLARQLVEAGARELIVLTRPEWTTLCKEALEDDELRGDVRDVRDSSDALSTIAGIAAAATGSLVLAHGEIVTHGGAVTGLMVDPRVSSGVLATGRTRRREGLALRLERGRLVSAESAYHATAKPTHRYLGFLKVGKDDRRAFEAAARALAGHLGDALPPLWEREFQRKIEEVWGRRFFSESAAAAFFAAELRSGDDLPAWFPATEAIRRRVREMFIARVVHPADAARLDVISLLVVALVRSDVTLRASYLRELYWARPFSHEAVEHARASLGLVNEDEVLLRSAVKAEDGFFTTFFVSPYSKYIARWAARRGFTPNQVTLVSLVVGLIGAAAFAVGTRAGLVAGAILLQASFTADCVDGQLARYTRRFSGIGAWLDSVFDRTKEYAVFAGLAFGAARQGGDDSIWLLAAAALAVQTARHVLDFAFAATQHGVIATVKRIPLDRPWDSANQATAVRYTSAVLDIEELADDESDAGSGPGGLRGMLQRLGGIGIEASRRFERASWMRFVKRIVVFPIGERFAAISLAAALSGARTVFVVVLVWGGVAAVYSGIGRILRSIA